MIISEKQIMKLISIVHQYVELISLIQMDGIKMNYPEEHKKYAIDLVHEINKQQSEELKEIQ